MPVSAAELLRNVDALSYELPTRVPRHLLEAAQHDAALAAQWEAFASSVRPVLDAAACLLLDAFLQAKRAHGSNLERELYRHMTPSGLVTRLLCKRPLTFFTAADEWLLTDGSRGAGGFERIGTEAEAAPLSLERLISYDEMALSALLGVSVPTHFINAGSRTNGGVAGEPSSHEASGVYVGLVGPRFERPGLMDWALLVLTPEQNTAEGGYGPPQPAEPAEPAAADGATPATPPASPVGGSAVLRRALLCAWAQFYGVPHLRTWEEAEAVRQSDPHAYLQIGPAALLDVALYKRRVRASVEPFLLEANARAAEADVGAYVHVVGLGLGAWQVHRAQGELVLQVYAELLRAHTLSHVRFIDFSWFPGECQSCGGVSSGEAFDSNDHSITILFSRRDPAASLDTYRKETGQQLLLVAMYAWDGNSYPGNEYWLGHLCASGDPAAACCSTISLLQNPDVNPTRLTGEAAVVYGPGTSDAAPIRPRAAK